MRTRPVPLAALPALAAPVRAVERVYLKVGAYPAARATPGG